MRNSSKTHNRNEVKLRKIVFKVQNRLQMSLNSGVSVGTLHGFTVKKHEKICLNMLGTANSSYIFHYIFCRHLSKNLNNAEKKI